MDRRSAALHRGSVCKFSSSRLLPVKEPDFLCFHWPSSDACCCKFVPIRTERMDPLVQLGDHFVSCFLYYYRLRSDEHGQHLEPSFRHHARSLELDWGVYNENRHIWSRSSLSPVERSVSRIVKANGLMVWISPR